MEAGLSKRAIDRAGERLQQWWNDDRATDDALMTDAELAEAFDIVFGYRASIDRPLRKVTVGVRQFVHRESTRVIVGQRLKRMPTIIDKLARHPTMKLTRMQDIGGCRAILSGGSPELGGVLRRIEKNWNVQRIYDYVGDPKPTGYRAVHAVVDRDDRLIEIQLRTPRQHEWAVAVERTGSRLNINLKDGQGPPELVRYFERAAHALALQEAGLPVDKAFETEFELLRNQVQQYFG